MQMNDDQMHTKGNKKRGFLVFLLIVSVAANVFFLLFEKKPREIFIEKMPIAEMNQIKEIAIICGGDSASGSNMSCKAMLFDIKSALSSAEAFFGSVLDEKDLKTVRSYLNDQRKLLKTIEVQNKFLSDLKGKRILVLPQEMED